MVWMRRIWSVLLAFVRRPRLEREMDAELRLHLEMQIEERVRRGESADAARHAAQRDFGGLEQIKEDCRDSFGYRWIEDMGKDLRYGCRTLLRSPGFTLVAVTTLALGIGANTAVFSVVNSVLLQRLPFHEPERLVMVWSDNPESGMVRDQCTPGDFFDWKNESRLIESMGFMVNSTTRSRNQMLMLDDRPIRIRGRFVSSGFFETLGVAPLLGRTMNDDEDLMGGEETAVLSFDIWKRDFNGDPEILGKPIEVLETSFVVVGVMPPGCRFPEDSELWLSTSEYLTPQEAAARWRHQLWVVARMKPGVTADEVQDELSVIQGQAFADNSNVNEIASAVTVAPLPDEVIGASTRPALLVLLAAVGFVLLIACANVANLMLARATARRKEIAIRTALGAGRLRMIRQLLTESLLLSLAGAAVGVLVAVGAIDIIRLLRVDDSVQSVQALRFDRFGDVSLDWSVLTFTLVLAILTGIIFGLIPAIQTARIDVNRILKEENRSGSPGRGSRRLGNSLVIAEVALAFMLLIGAGQMTLTFIRMQQVDPGLQTESVLRAEIDLQMAAHAYAGDVREVTHQILTRIESLPIVTSVGAINEGILRESGWAETFGVAGRAINNANELLRGNVRVVTPGTLEALGVPLIHGRHITEHDSADAPTAVLVNEEFVRRYFHGENPVGERLKFRNWNRTPGDEIVGVCGNVRNFRLDTEDQPEVFYCYYQKPWGGADLGPILVARTHGDPTEAIASLRHEVEGPDPEGAILVKFRTLDDMLSSSASHERFRTVLIGSFSALAVLLAAVGVYGVISFSTSQRTHELGIRAALGAQSGDILRLVVQRGIVLGVTGVLIGLLLAMAVSRVLASQFYGVVEADALMFSAAAITLLLVTIVASFVPARRATSIDPTRALRHG